METAGLFFLKAFISNTPKGKDVKNRRFGCYVQEAERAHCIEPIPERVEGTTLREEHE